MFYGLVQKKAEILEYTIKSSFESLIDTLMEKTFLGTYIVICGDPMFYNPFPVFRVSNTSLLHSLLEDIGDP